MRAVTQPSHRAIKVASAIHAMNALENPCKYCPYQNTHAHCPENYCHKVAMIIDSMLKEKP